MEWNALLKDVEDCRLTSRGQALVDVALAA
ncbi:hypothetical protein SAMN04490197_3937 [Pseudomonas orientalis]|uniref:Uncharacterized protein n=1 Tax=Pseudomonas orientalis TaxID=76758 RepID=A0A8B3Y137_9PSED|nr:hypothetical protein SAMN04490197_3937 [Pseudomonas orientalis]